MASPEGPACPEAEAFCCRGREGLREAFPCAAFSAEETSPEKTSLMKSPSWNRKKKQDIFRNNNNNNNIQIYQLLSLHFIVFWGHTDR